MRTEIAVAAVAALALLGTSATAGAVVLPYDQYGAPYDYTKAETDTGSGGKASASVDGDAGGYGMVEVSAEGLGGTFAQGTGGVGAVVGFDQGPMLPNTFQAQVRPEQIQVYGQDYCFEGDGSSTQFAEFEVNFVVERTLDGERVHEKTLFRDVCDTSQTGDGLTTFGQLSWMDENPWSTVTFEEQRYYRLYVEAVATVDSQDGDAGVDVCQPPEDGDHICKYGDSDADHEVLVDVFQKENLDPGTEIYGAEWYVTNLLYGSEVDGKTCDYEGKVEYSEITVDTWTGSKSARREPGYLYECHTAEVRHTFLAPGSYHADALGQDDWGQSGEDEERYPVTILPPSSAALPLEEGQAVHETFLVDADTGEIVDPSAAPKGASVVTATVDYDPVDGACSVALDGVEAWWGTCAVEDGRLEPVEHGDDWLLQPRAHVEDAAGV